VQIHHDGITLHVAEDGDLAAPPILLLHGITSFGGTWDWFVPELAERFRVLRLDFRGHGASDRTPDRYGAAGYARDAIAAIEQVAGGPCVLIGHSLGGITAATVLQQRPDLVRAAVLEDPPLQRPRVDDNGLENNALMGSFRLMRDTLPGLQETGIANEVLAGILASAPSADGTPFGERLHADALAAMAGSLLAVDVTVLDPVLNGTITSVFDLDAPLLQPCLIVAADPAQPDSIADPEVAQHLADISPATEVVVVEGAGHLIHDELASRETFRSAAVGFLDRVLASTT
jgi:pimeloyl-ACP methyl ester carboxylesterase